MADEKQVEEEVVAEDTDTSEQTSTDTQQDKKAKVTFTPEQQSHVNALLAAERKATEKKFKTQLEGTQSALDTRQSDVEFYEEQLSKVVDAQTSDWDAVTRDLFNALPVKERLEKLADEKFMAQVRRKNKVPVTPKEDGKAKPMYQRRQSI